VLIPGRDIDDMRSLLRPGTSSGDLIVLPGGDIGLGGQGPNLPAVPEPGTWALLLAGLGLVVVVARRRSARPAQA
jgi:hypothetical protein